MLWVVLGIVSMMTVSLFGLSLLFLQMWKSRLQEFQQEREFWRNLCQDQQNRLMTKDWTQYVQMTPNESLSSTSEVLGMSDEEELRRMHMFLSEGQPVGEVLADLSDDLEALGLKTEDV